ncbi:hypothetical protein BPOR_0346g00050 [Botrytis porri]|uniref:Uncharacterized protein n=1 Tax=Botrytis porri TaxID=87229 RepID=A0A4Z1KQ93_9HELO|nr:hypothetical protein BPOR_0346g00050 [Botrytis porri]
MTELAASQYAFNGLAHIEISHSIDKGPGGPEDRTKNLSTIRVPVRNEDIDQMPHDVWYGSKE